jgi:hypothetical protein
MSQGRKELFEFCLLKSGFAVHSRICPDRQLRHTENEPVVGTGVCIGLVKNFGQERAEIRPSKRAFIEPT